MKGLWSKANTANFNCVLYKILEFILLNLFTYIIDYQTSMLSFL